MINQKYTYLLKPERGRKRTPFWHLAIFLWGGETDFDSDGNSANPVDGEWTELTLSNRMDTTQRIDIDPKNADPLILKIVGTTQSLAAQAAYYLAAVTNGKVSEVEPIAWRSPRMLKKQLEHFDVQEAITRVVRYVAPKEIGKPAYFLAHKHSSYHRAELKKSELCGCFYCLHCFQSTEIHSWLDKWDGVDQTALCPKCGIDSVIGSASGYPIEQEFLETMKAYWFSPASSE